MAENFNEQRATHFRAPQTYGVQKTEPERYENGETFDKNDAISYRGGEPMIDKNTPRLTDEQRKANELAAKGDTDTGKIQGVSVIQKPSTAVGSAIDANPLVNELNRQKELQAKQVPTGGDGRAVNNWLGNTVGTKKGTPETKEQSRQQIRYITALGDVLRGINDMYWAKRGAKPTQQVNQNAVMEQMWAKEDAEQQAKDKLKAEQERKNAELKFKQQTADRAERTLQETINNNKFNHAVALDKNKRDNEAHQANLAKIAAGIENQKTTADLNKQKFEETKAQNARSNALRAQSNSIAGANAATSRARLNFEKGKYADTKAKQTIFKANGKTYKGQPKTTPQGAAYVFSDAFLTGENIRKLYYGLHNTTRKLPQYNVNGVTDSKEKYNIMLNAVMYGLGNTKEEHDWVVKHANKLGYQYIGGMSDANYTELMGKPRNNKVTLK